MDVRLVVRSPFRLLGAVVVRAEDLGRFAFGAGRVTRLPDRLAEPDRTRLDDVRPDDFAGRPRREAAPAAGLLVLLPLLTLAALLFFFFFAGIGLAGPDWAPPTLQFCLNTPSNWSVWICQRSANATPSS